MQDSIQFITAQPDLFDNARALLGGYSLGTLFIAGAAALAMVCRL